MVTETDFCCPRSEPLSEKEAKVLSPITISHLLARMAALDPVEGGSSGKRKTFREPPTMLGSLVEKAKANTWYPDGVRHRG